MKNLICGLLIIFSFGCGLYLGRNYFAAPVINTYGDFEARVARTRDGDTAVIEIHGESEPIRYIGIDTPETKHPKKGAECFGKEAAGKNQELVLGRSVRFERDKRNRDHRGRLLRYVWTGDKMINLELVRSGYAFASHVSPNGKYRKQFEEAEATARFLNLGLWASCPVFVAERDDAKQKTKKNKHGRKQ